MALSETLDEVTPDRSLSAMRRTHRVSGTTLELFLPCGWPEGNMQIDWFVRSGATVSQGQATDLDEIPAYLKSTHVVAWTPPAGTDTVFWKGWQSKFNPPQLKQVNDSDQLSGKPSKATRTSSNGSAPATRPN